MTFPVEVVLKGRDFAVTESVSVAGDPASWDDAEVREVLVHILRAIQRAERPETADGAIMLRGVSWIVEPVGREVVIAIEIPMGAAVAGPFQIPQADLDAKIARVIRADAQFSAAAPGRVH
jgi:hypothetical protein